MGGTSAAASMSVGIFFCRASSIHSSRWIFPASSAGGPSHIKALASVFPGVAFCPTGGVDVVNVAAYLAAGAAFVGMGGALVDEARIAAGDRAAIEAVARGML